MMKRDHPSKILNFVSNTISVITNKIFKNIWYCSSKKNNEIYSHTFDLIDDESKYHIDRINHEMFSNRAIFNYKIQKSESIKEIYKPGLMWNRIIKTVDTYNTWIAKQDDTVLQNALKRFYRTDLIFGHSGDAYIWEIKNGELDFRLQVFMLIKRYEEFIHDQPEFGKENITTTDIGHQIYTEYQGNKLTFKTIRHAFYLNRMSQLNVLPGKNGIIGELGAGAGEMAIITKKAYPGYKYICFDLPETLLVSSYNVMMSFPDKKIGLYEDFKDKQKITREDIGKFDLVLLPNWCIERLEENAVDVFLNIGSLSEMDLPIINNYIKNIERITKDFFYTVNRNVRDVEEFGVHDIPITDFPFSKSVVMTHSQYDIGSDIYHSTYGMNYRCNYWEYVFDLSNK